MKFLNLDGYADKKNKGKMSARLIDPESFELTTKRFSQETGEEKEPIVISGKLEQLITIRDRTQSILDGINTLIGELNAAKSKLSDS